MTSRDFCYWLQGFFELRQAAAAQGEAIPISGQQAQLVERHLALVFKHEIDPAAGGPTHQKALDALHQGLVAGSQTKIGGHGIGPGGEHIVYRC
jgi:hypothetical protein